MPGKRSLRRGGHLLKTRHPLGPDQRFKPRRIQGLNVHLLQRHVCTLFSSSPRSSVRLPPACRPDTREARIEAYPDQRTPPTPSQEPGEPTQTLKVKRNILYGRDARIVETSYAR
jgi:hypothetical protein